MSIEDIVYYDYKEFETNDMGYGIGQILTLDYKKRLDNLYNDFYNIYSDYFF